MATETKRRMFWGVASLPGVALALFSIHFLLAKPPSGGAPLAGWHVQGPAVWRAENTGISGSLPAKAVGSGWLVRDEGYEDFLLRFQFRCHPCEGGVLLRSKKSATGTQGIYVSFSGANVGGVYRVQLDAGGREVDRRLLGIPHNDADDLKVQFPMQPDGWNVVELDVRGDDLVEVLNGYRVRPLKLKEAAPAGEARFGLIALGLSGAGAQINIRDFSIEDLTQRSSLPPEVTESPFREKKLTDLFYGEGIAAGDLNRDGHQDVVAGPFYYLGPDFKIAREIYPSKTYNVDTPPYTDSFMQYVYDFNGDGWPDVLKVNFDGAYLYINPRGERRHWEVYQVVKGISAETTKFMDIDGDGHPELLISQGKDLSLVLSFAEPDWSNPTKPWAIHPISKAGDWGVHGMGIGDINGDGRLDVVLATGWWEQPLRGSKEPWKHHAANFGAGPWAEMEGTWAAGSDMFVYDVNGDGLPDIVASLGAHAWGLAWFEQKRDAAGSISWKRHLIMGNPWAPDRQEWEETDKSVAFSELHAVGLADINGDGLKDIVTGKRWWSHGDNFSGPDAQAPPVLYWFQLVRKPGGAVQWIPHLINNNSGVGTQILVTDINGDGKPDVLTSARKGTFVFLNSPR